MILLNIPAGSEDETVWEETRHIWEQTRHIFADGRHIDEFLPSEHLDDLVLDEHAISRIHRTQDLVWTNRRYNNGIWGLQGHSSHQGLVNVTGRPYDAVVAVGLALTEIAARIKRKILVLPVYHQAPGWVEYSLPPSYTRTLNMGFTVFRGKDNLCTIEADDEFWYYQVKGTIGDVPQQIPAGTPGQPPKIETSLCGGSGIYSDPSVVSFC